MDNLMLLFFEWFKSNALELIVGGGGAIAWFKDRNRLKGEIETLKLSNKSMNIDNDKKLIDVYQDVVDDLVVRYDAKFKSLEEDIHRLETNLKLWKTKYKTLRDEFTAYKQNIEK